MVPLQKLSTSLILNKVLALPVIDLYNALHHLDKHRDQEMNEKITQLSFRLTSTVWVVDYKYIGGSVLKVGQIIEKYANHYEVLSGSEYSQGMYTYQVKQVKLPGYTYARKQLPQKH